MNKKYRFRNQNAKNNYKLKVPTLKNFKNK